MSHEVVILAYPDLVILDLAGPAQVFTAATTLLAERGRPGYRLTLVAATPGPIVTSSGLAVIAAALATAPRPDTFLIPGGPGARLPPAAGLRAWLTRTARAARRTASVCTGAFLLAETGLLAGRHVTTHWRHGDELQARFPDLRVDPDPIFLRDGKFWSSAGISAGIDLALALVEADHGRDLAMAVARQLVVFLRRSGGQSQYSAAFAAQAAATPFAALHDWLLEHLDTDLTVERLAARAGMTARTFARRYQAAIGITPAKQIERLRVEAARRALEQDDVAVAEIARRTGFGDEERMRRAFHRQLGVPPRAYRQRFGAAAD